MLLDITWTADPVIFSIGPKEIRWYTLMFLVGFAVGYKIVERMFRREGLNEKWLDPLLYFTLAGTLIGARLGHCLFYNPSYYFSHPVEILKVWEGGLASHGGVLGMIRIGNLMNHEIYGHPTDLPWGFRFVKNLYAWRHGAAPIFTPPSHPTQLYEAVCYLLTFVLCMWLYFKRDAWKREGLIFGIFMICIFTARFFVEFLKNYQEDFEASLPLDMGQLLSIPFILLGIYCVWRALKQPVQS